jgi:hypothetical protein
MRCNKAREFVNRELDAILPPDATGDLLDHLDACADCRTYREDLLVGQRLLKATEPALPDNFEWKLQLKLNRALQEAAGEALYPWEEEQPDRWLWWRNFGAATAVGLAAVLALAMVFGPVEPARRGTGPAPVVAASDRLPLFQPSTGGLYRPAAQPVSRTGRAISTGRYVDGGWTGSATEDLRTIQRLKAENRRLTSTLLQVQRLNASLRAQLDTTGVRPLDLGHAQE